MFDAHIHAPWCKERAQGLLKNIVQILGSTLFFPFDAVDWGNGRFYVPLSENTYCQVIGISKNIAQSRK